MRFPRYGRKLEGYNHSEHPVSSNTRLRRGLAFKVIFRLGRLNPKRNGNPLPDKISMNRC